MLDLIINFTYFISYGLLAYRNWISPDNLVINYKMCYNLYCVLIWTTYHVREKTVYYEVIVICQATKNNSRYRKYKELVHMACLANQLSQPSLNISPIWIPLISNEVTNWQRSVWCDRLFSNSDSVHCTPPSRQWSKWVIKHRSIWYNYESSSVPSFVFQPSPSAVHQAGQYAYCYGYRCQHLNGRND
jgi:hypothetical protein